MPQKSATGVDIPVLSDQYDIPDWLLKISNGTRSVIPISSDTERGGLAGKFPGGVLPIPTVISRIDVPGAPLEIWDGSAWFSGRGTPYAVSWLGVENWGVDPQFEGYYWRNGDQVRVMARGQASATNTVQVPSLGTGVIRFTLPPGLPVGNGFMATGGGLHNTNGTSGILRQVMTAAGPGQTDATVWAIPGVNPAQTPGAAGFPFATNASFHVWIEYRTSA